MNDDTNMTEADVILAAGASGLAPRVVDGDGIPYAVTPQGYRLESLEPFLASPRRFRTKIETCDVTSMILYLAKFKDDASRIYYRAVPDGARFIGVINDHIAHGLADTWAARWRDHIVTYDCPFSPEFMVWKSKNGQAMSHADFATFVDDNQLDFADPAGSRMLEISRSMRAAKKVNWVSDRNLANGSNQLTFEEQVEGAAGPKGEIKIPEEITIGIPVFVNGDRFGIRANLRYKLEGGRLSIWYSIITPHVVIQNAVADVVKKLEVLALPIIHGWPNLPS